jgi:hypothetical protein
MFGVISIKYDETHRIIAFSVSYFHNAHIYTYTIMRICASQLSAAFFYFAVNATQTAYNFQSWSFKNTPSSRQVKTCSSSALFLSRQKSSFASPNQQSCTQLIALYFVFPLFLFLPSFDEHFAHHLSSSLQFSADPFSFYCAPSVLKLSLKAKSSVLAILRKLILAF